MFGAVQKKPFVFVYEPERVEIVHGPACRSRDGECVVHRCDEDGVPIFERRGGGGTVVLAPGMVVTLVVGERAGLAPTACFNRIHDAMIALLEQAGVRGIVRSGISDLAIGSRKILGSSLYMGNRPPYFYYQSSLLVNHDPALFDRYLHHPPREPEYRRRRQHREFCTSLAIEGYRVDVASIAGIFSEHLAGRLTRGG
jgi:lipoate-protein ligase A